MISENLLEINTPPTRFLTDRMLGTLTRYLRFLGFDTKSATTLGEGNPGEDSFLLKIAKEEERILLTGDRELARRAGIDGIFIGSGSIQEQIQILHARSLLKDIRLFTRCSLCNTVLIPLTADSDYASRIPEYISQKDCTFCPSCQKIFWKGSHTERIFELFKELQLI
ncbi:MAG: Mut7-C RNAse domain-containing protein [Methanospirillaceae archaeon]|nr:Mut7-C RNAse domain-containing protein [Methanospirillaceae archaeon]